MAEPTELSTTIYLKLRLDYDKIEDRKLTYDIIQDGWKLVDDDECKRYQIDASISSRDATRGNVYILTFSRKK